MPTLNEFFNADVARGLGRRYHLINAAGVFFHLEELHSVTDGIRAGVVSLPHGWGHDKEGTRLSVAREHAGVNSNVLAPGTFIDEISGNAAVNGIPVTVTASA